MLHLKDSLKSLPTNGGSMSVRTFTLKKDLALTSSSAYFWIKLVFTSDEQLDRPSFDVITLSFERKQQSALPSVMYSVYIQFEVEKCPSELSLFRRTTKFQ